MGQRGARRSRPVRATLHRWRALRKLQEPQQIASDDLAHDRLLKLNPVAHAICQRLAARQTEPAIARALAHAYGVAEHRVAADVRALRRQLAALGVAPWGVQ